MLLRGAAGESISLRSSVGSSRLRFSRIDVPQDALHRFLERQEFLGCRLPHHAVVDLVVIVTDHVADAHDATPWARQDAWSARRWGRKRAASEIRAMLRSIISRRPSSAMIVLRCFAGGQLLDPGNALAACAPGEGGGREPASSVDRDRLLQDLVAQPRAQLGSECDVGRPAEEGSQIVLEVDQLEQAEVALRVQFHEQIDVALRISCRRGPLSRTGSGA